MEMAKWAEMGTVTIDSYADHLGKYPSGDGQEREYPEPGEL